MYIYLYILVHLCGRVCTRAASGTCRTHPSGNYACIYMSDKNAFICHQDLKGHIYVE